MGSKKVMCFAAAVIVLSMCVSAQAGWTEPIHLTELNTPGYSPSWPAISSDESIIYFLRKANDGSQYLWEAQKNEDTGLYEQQRIVSEIGGSLGGKSIWGVWISEDSHHLYNCWTDPYSGWKRFISMAVRNNSDELWQQTRKHSELQQGHKYLNAVSLTSDELNIMWSARFGDTDSDTVFTASRSSRNSDFSNIRAVTELDEIGADDPYMSADGLTVYFHIMNDDGFYEIWKGSRNSLAEPFGNFEPLDDINRPGAHYCRPCITADGSALYFFRGAPSWEHSVKGIYVSYNLSQLAVNNIRKAIAEKEAAIGKIDAAIDAETAAVEVIDEMLESENYGDQTKQDIVRAKRELLKGIQKQVSARKALEDSLEILNNSLAILLGE